MEVLLKSKIVRETLKAKGYDINQVEKGRAKIGEDLRGLLENLADDKPVVRNNDKDESEVTTLRRNEAAYGEDSLNEKQLDEKDVVQSLVQKVPEETLRQTMVRKKKVSFREEAEHLGLGQESGEWPTSEEDAEEEKLSGESDEWDEDSEKSGNDQDNLCVILAEEKMRHCGRELRTGPSSGTYNLDQQEVYEGEELDEIAVSRKPFRELSCNSNVRTNLVPDDDRKVLTRIVCVKLKDDIHSPGKLNGKMMALKEHVKARNRLSDLIRAQKNNKRTSNLSKLIQTRVKMKGDLEEDSYKTLSQFYKEGKDLLYHTAG